MNEDLFALVDTIISSMIHRQHRLDEPLNIAFIHPGQSTTHLNGNFLHAQVSLDVLLRMKPTATEKTEFISLCRKMYQNNEQELAVIDEFERNYKPDRALWWYTRESFLYQFLNQALRTQNMDQLFHLRFFIRDIEQQLKNDPCTSPMRLYRGQQISKEELGILKNSIGQFISVNSFFATSANLDQALEFLPDPDPNGMFKNVLFEIDANPRIKGVKPFANITKHSFYPDEEEILFMCGAIFQLLHVSQKEELCTIQLRLCGEKENNLRETCEHMKQGYGSKTDQTDLLSFGTALTKMGRYDEAEKYFRRLLNELPSNHSGIADCYHNLGELEMERGDYHSSLNYHQKALALRQKSLDSNHPDLAETYNSMGIAYRKQGDFQLAMDAFERALRIFEVAYSSNHSKIGMCLNNIGNLYTAEQNHSLALNYYLKALAIQEKDLPADHPDLATFYCNIGSAYQCLQNDTSALEYFQRSLKIFEKTLPSEHPALATILKNIGIIHENQGHLREAQRHFQRAAAIRRAAFSRNHPDVIRIEEDLRRVQSQIK